jgi:hypothetical protein
MNSILRFLHATSTVALLALDLKHLAQRLDPLSQAATALLPEFAASEPCGTCSLPCALIKPDFAEN